MCQVIRKIPRGKVATYGQVAAMAGNPRDPRSVGWVLHGCSESEKLPWFRVINREGKISLRRVKGTKSSTVYSKAKGSTLGFRDRIDLKFQWQPKSPWLHEEEICAFNQKIPRRKPR
ncbi:MAG: MGMT family protein [bacterium]|nr:MGMT family protein [bacterium]